MTCPELSAPWKSLAMCSGSPNASSSWPPWCGFNGWHKFRFPCVWKNHCHLEIEAATSGSNLNMDTKVSLTLQVARSEKHREFSWFRMETAKIAKIGGSSFAVTAMACCHEFRPGLCNLLTNAVEFIHGERMLRGVAFWLCGKSLIRQV